MARVYHPAYGVRKITIGRFAIYFVIFEALMWFADAGLGIEALDNVFLLGLIIVPILVFPWVLWARTNPSDEEFESPAIWIALALLGVLAFIALVVIGIYALAQGSVGSAGYMLTASLLVITFSILMLRSARDRREEWRRMRKAQRMSCPVCRVRVQNSVGICPSCGAIVFWVPSWMNDD